MKSIAALLVGAISTTQAAEKLGAGKCLALALSSGDEDAAY